jgi:hypothetical protein
MPWGQDESDLVCIIWINPKESKIQRNQKNKESKKNQKTMFSRLA